MKLTTAFTLIELLIVVAIIGVLAAIAVPNFMMAQVRANVAKVRGEFISIGTAVETYRLDQGTLSPMTDHGYPGRHYRTSSFLTTPISYLTALAHDPFQDQGEDPFGLIADPNVFPRYRYHNVRQLLNDNDVIDIPASDLDVGVFGQYRFISNGPDRTYQGYTRYHSSNGITSRGDLYFAEKGMENVLIPNHNIGSGTFR